MNNSENGITQIIMELPFFKAEWVLWLLIIGSVISVVIIIERAVFYGRHKINLKKVKEKLATYLEEGDFEKAASFLARQDSLETNVILAGLQNHKMGPESVEDLLIGTAAVEQAKYEKRLPILATIASIAPFLGLFGTVLGIMTAFNDLAGNMHEASSAVMAGIAEALTTTAIGLVVAIPAVIAYNAFKGIVKNNLENLNLLSGVLTANLKAVSIFEETQVKED